MKRKLIDYIVCPICKSGFTIKTNEDLNADIVEGTLICKNRHKFPINNSVPRLVVDNEKNFVNTENAFSSKWKNYSKTYHDKRWYAEQKRWFLDRFGWKTSKNFNKFLKTRTCILDAGTGVGNSAHWFSSNPSSQVFAIDASESVIFAHKKYGDLDNIHFLQADIRNLPFKKQFFDFICSDQVLHHTKDTESSFKYLTKFLKKKGLISIYVYKKKGPIREFTDDFIRKYTVNMSEKDCINFSKEMAELGKSLSRINKKVTIKRDIPILGIKAGTYDVQRFIYWNFIKCWWSDTVPYAQSIATNFDWYFPRFAYRHTPNEVRQWFKDVKFEITHFQEIESGISISGKKTS